MKHIKCALKILFAVPVLFIAVLLSMPQMIGVLAGCIEQDRVLVDIIMDWYEKL